MKRSTAVRTKLAKGNAAFVTSSDHQLLSRLASEGQSPAVAVLTCSDSRVAPERIFDLSLGEAFVVRMPGNCVSDRAVLGSIEYAVDRLRVKAVVVLGHSDCGVIKGTSACSCIEGLEGVAAEIDAVRQGLTKEHAADASAVAEMNVRVQLSALTERSRVIREAVGSGKVELIGAMYNLSTGEVGFL